MASDPIQSEVSHLYSEHGTALLRYAHSVVRNRESARDAVQEAFLRYYTQRREGNVILSPRAWLYKVAFNCLMDGAANFSEPLELAANSPDPACSPLEQAEAVSLRSRFAQILAPRELACVNLRAEGLSYDEIGEVLGIQIGTVGAMLARAVRKIKKDVYRI